MGTGALGTRAQFGILVTYPSQTAPDTWVYRASLHLGVELLEGDEKLSKSLYFILFADVDLPHELSINTFGVWFIQLNDSD